jgi:hypothetical protein
VPITAVLGLLGWQHRSRSGEQLRGPCPIHQSTSPKSRSFAVNIRRNIWYCHAPACKSGGNQLDLWAAATGLTEDPYQAALDLCEKLGLEVPYIEQPEQKRRRTRTKRSER